MNEEVSPAREPWSEASFRIRIIVRSAQNFKSFDTENMRWNSPIVQQHPEKLGGKRDFEWKNVLFQPHACEELRDKLIRRENRARKCNSTC